MEANNLSNIKQNKKGLGKAAFMIIGLVIGMALASVLTYCLMNKDSNKASEKVEGTGYESPEKAVEAYLNYLKEGNLEGAISTFAVESYVDNYDMTEYYNYNQSFFPYGAGGGQMTNGLYFDSDMSRDLNIESRRSYIIYGLHKHLTQITLQNTDEKELADEIAEGKAQISLEEPESVESLMRFLSTDPALDSIVIGDFLDEQYYNPNNSEPIENSLKHQEKVWGSDVKPVMVKLKIGGKDYTLFMLCVCYDGKWYIAEFNNTIGLSYGITAVSKGLVSDEDLP